MDIKMEVSQQIVLSQKMIQSARILQMSSQELEDYLNETAMENPVVEVEEKYDPGDERQDLSRKLEWLEGSDEQNRIYYSQDNDEDDKQGVQNLSDNRGEDLGEYLESQLMVPALSDQERQVASYLIGMLDARGYYTEDPQESARRTGSDEGTVLRMLHLIQTFDPAGVGARNLSECLLLQMDRREISDPTARRIAEEYLPEIARNRLPSVAKKMKVSVDEVQRALGVIRTLNPKPGNSFSSRENLKYIVPDVTVVKLDGYFEILINEYMYPSIQISPYYSRMAKETGDRETREYIDGKIRQAEWVMQCISQRNSTLLNVARSIVDHQIRFFEKGKGHLVPLRMTEVAQEFGMHESTVSRAVRDKYLQCAHGVYPMNYFFTGAASRQSNGASVSSDRVKTMLRDIIDSENHNKPYSDRILSEMLARKGIAVSRRTVAKYRESMGIRDASGRKVFDKK